MTMLQGSEVTYGKSAYIGWLAFSVVFNSLNTIVYGLLYPNLLRDFDKNATQSFFFVNLLTTIFSALLYPFFGTVLDSLKVSKRSMDVCGLLGVAATFSLYPAYEHFDRAVFLFIYAFAMFFLRISVMNNNTLLAVFPVQQRVPMSLAANLLGFGVNLGGLLTLYYAEKHMSRIHWVLCFVVIGGTAWVLALMAPSQGPVEPSHLRFSEAVFKAFWQNIRTVCAFCSDRELRATILFLVAYGFFCTAGAAFTVFLTVFFRDNYPVADVDHQASEVNLVFKVAMVVGVGAGMSFEAWMARRKRNMHRPSTYSAEEATTVLEQTGAARDHKLLLFHNVLYTACYALMWCDLRFKWGYAAGLSIAAVVSFTYGWNMSVSRAMLTKLCPPYRMGEIVGFYSTFTYLGIALVSATQYIMSTHHLGTEHLPAILFCMLIPSYYFLWLLRSLAPLPATQPFLVSETS